MTPGSCHAFSRSCGDWRAWQYANVKVEAKSGSRRASDCGGVSAGAGSK